MPAIQRYHDHHPPKGLAFLFCLIALVCIPLTINAANNNIPLGSKLLPDEENTRWVSSSGSFQLAFYAVDSSSYSVGILYYTAGINGTVVWTAGRDVQVGKLGSLELSSDGNLVLMNDSVTGVWNSSTRGVGVMGATMQDDGNFVLYNSSSGVLWQSFASPTDTLVQNQQLQQGQSLTAGSYTATMEAAGNLSLIYNSSYTYWYSNTDNTSVYASLQSTSLGVYNKQGQAIKIWYSDDYSVTSVQMIRRVTLDVDGNLRIYSWSVGSSSEWRVGWKAVEDQCEVYGYCGHNGLCSYNSSGITCGCAEQAGYAFVDGNNPRSGCKAIAGNGGQNCNSTAASMVVLNNTMLFSSDRSFFYGNSDCSQKCLTDQVCTAATAVNDGSTANCRMLTAGQSFSGYQELSISANTFLKICGSARSISTAVVPSPSKRTSATVPAIASAFATLAVVALVQGTVWYLCCRRRFGGDSAHYALLEYGSWAPVQLSYRELKNATQNFQDKLGEGGFGAVYKGRLPWVGAERSRTETEVAVKRLDGIGGGEKQFRMEVAIIGSKHHMNLARLCGFCAEGKHRLLVYEYMKNGSLDRYLSAVEEGQDTLDWETRFNVLVGAARGITYLHQECQECIIHCDIKPENILLDDTYTAKVSDFGLAKLTNADGLRARIVTTPTPGCLAPEWTSTNLPITVKSDVFSFGMLVLQTISGKKNLHTPLLSSSTATRHSFSAWAYRHYFDHNQVDGIVDPRISEQVDMEELDRALKVAFWCMQVQPSLRPSMSKVIQMLEGTLPLDPPPMPTSLGEVFSTEQAAMLRALELQNSPATSSTARTISCSTFTSTSTSTSITTGTSPSTTSVRKILR